MLRRISQRMVRRPQHVSGTLSACSHRHSLLPTSASSLPSINNRIEQFRYTGSDSGSGSSSSRSLSAEEINQIVHRLEKDHDLLTAVMEKLDSDSRRRLVIAGGAAEWFGKETVATEVSEADVGKDKVICPKDFDRWFESALKRHQAKDGGAAGTGGPVANAAAAKADKTAASGTAAPTGAINGAVPLFVLFLIGLEAGLPFVGFGFLDNATMVLAGDAIDRSLGMWLHCSVMASAAMGNVVSGMLGMQVHGFIEKLVQKLKLPVPALTVDQQRSQRVFMAGHLGGTIGIAVGLTLGMLPLLFLSDESDQKSDKKLFDELDTSGDGMVSTAELLEAMRKISGLKMDRSAAEAIVKKYSDGKSKLTFEQFHELCDDLRGS